MNNERSEYQVVNNSERTVYLQLKKYGIEDDPMIHRTTRKEQN